MKNLLIVLILVLSVSCSLDSDPIEPRNYTQENEEEILAYISDNDLIAEKSVTGLYYVIDELGDGIQPTNSSDVTVVYKGYFSSGAVFDQSVEEGIELNLKQVISGFSEGITYFQEGGNGILLIPSRLAYGNVGSGPIPPGAVLIFDISLISVND
jgi:FKBP-type peptidyl-prolyl cis-trans isomerase FkpA